MIYGGRVEKLDLRTQQTQTIDPTLVYRDVDRATWTLPSPSRGAIRASCTSRASVSSARRTAASIGPRSAPTSAARTRACPPPWTPPPPPTSRARDGATASSIRSRPRAWPTGTSGSAPTTEGLAHARRGRTLARRHPAGLAPWSKVGIIDASHFDPETAYIAVDRHRLDDFRPYVYRTHDGGKTWTAVANGIPEGQAVNVVREDPARRGLLYAGTERGVFVSFDDGDHWQSLQMNLPVTSVRDIDVHGNDVVIGTHGRAFWVLDDVTPLRQMDGATRRRRISSPPPPSVRVRPAGFTGTPVPKDEPMAANPPAGASIDYVLNGPAAGPVVIRIADAEGRTVARVQQRGPAARHGPHDDPRRPGMDSAPVAARPDTRDAPVRVADPLSGARGPWPTATRTRTACGRLPGRYTVELSVGQSQRTQPLTILPDPRVTMTPEAYARQFALARRIEAAAARVAEAVTALDTVHKRLAGGGRPTSICASRPCSGQISEVGWSPRHRRGSRRCARSPASSGDSWTPWTMRTRRLRRTSRPDSRRSSRWWRPPSPPSRHSLTQVLSTPRLEPMMRAARLVALVVALLPAAAGAGVPDVFDVRLETSKGPIVIEVHREWAPIGAARFHDLVRAATTTTRASSASWPAAGPSSASTAIRAWSARWRHRTIPDDPRASPTRAGRSPSPSPCPRGGRRRSSSACPTTRRWTRRGSRPSAA